MGDLFGVTSPTDQFRPRMMQVARCYHQGVAFGAYDPRAKVALSLTALTLEFDATAASVFIPGLTPLACRWNE